VNIAYKKTKRNLNLTRNILKIQQQPVGFVTFHTRAGAEAAKQDLQVTYN